MGDFFLWNQFHIEDDPVFILDRQSFPMGGAAAENTGMKADIGVPAGIAEGVARAAVQDNILHMHMGPEGTELPAGGTIAVHKPAGILFKLKPDRTADTFTGQGHSSVQILFGGERITAFAKEDHKD